MDAGAEDRQTLLRGDRSDRFYLCTLFALILPLRIWLLFNTEVAARDSIGYIRYALQLESKGFTAAICSNDQQPGYPMCIWAASAPLRAWHGGPDPELMRISAQLVSALASLLLIAPLYFLGKELLGARIAFWGTLLFQFLPVSGQHLSDGVTEPLFFLLITTSLWQAVRGMRLAESGDPAPSTFVAYCLAGLFSGLAYWTRPEGAFVVAAAGLTLVGRQLLVHRRCWRRFLVHGLCLATPALALAGAYFSITGSFMTKPSTRLVVGVETLASASRLGNSPLQPVAHVENRHALFASTFGAFIPRADDYPTRFRRAAQTYAMELAQGFHYLGVVFVVLGLCWFGRDLARSPGVWILLVYGLLQSVTLILLAMRAFYISDRHMMVLIMPGCFLMAAGLLESGRRIHMAIRSRKPQFPRISLPLVLAALMVAFCLPKTLQRVHGNRVGNHRAGLWLASQLMDGDLVVDDHCWSHYYAGQVFVEGNEPFVSPEYQPRCYIVITRSRIQSVDEARKNEERQLQESGARVVYQWPTNVAFEKARVVVYEMSRNFGSHPWKVAKLN